MNAEALASDDDANNKGLSLGTESMNGNTNGVEYDDKHIDVISSGRMTLALKDQADQTLQKLECREVIGQSLDSQVHQVLANLCDERWPQQTILGSGQGGC